MYRCHVPEPRGNFGTGKWLAAVRDKEVRIAMASKYGLQLLNDDGCRDAGHWSKFYPPGVVVDNA